MTTAANSKPTRVTALDRAGNRVFVFEAADRRTAVTTAVGYRQMGYEVQIIEGVLPMNGEPVYEDSLGALYVCEVR